jgi:flagella basal body P-ring formation protein FlgA
MIATEPRRTWWLRALAVIAAVAVAMAAASRGTQAATLDLPVPRTTIYPGETISAEQLAERAFLAHTVTRSTVFDNREGLIGKVARRTLLPGQPVPVNAIRDPYLVILGKGALVVFEADGLTITMQAVALQNGVAGDVVTLRNPDSGVVIQGLVDRDGTVRMGAP